LISQWSKYCFDAKSRPVQGQFKSGLWSGPSHFVRASILSKTVSSEHFTSSPLWSLRYQGSPSPTRHVFGRDCMNRTYK
jgi:hypothetical protein